MKMCSSDWFKVGGSLEKDDVTVDQSKVYGRKPLSIKFDQITHLRSLWSPPVITEYCRHFMWKPDFSVWNVSATQRPQEIPQWNEEVVSNRRTLLLASNPKMKCISVCGWKENERRFGSDDQRPEETGKTGAPAVRALNTFVMLIQRD